MKPTFKTLATLFIASLVLGISSYVMASSPLTTIKLENVKSIEVSGNVSLILIQDAKEAVQIHDSYFGNNALVQQQGSVLRLSSYAAEPLKIVVSVAQLQNLTLSGESTVKTSGGMSLLSLNVKLKDYSSADLNMEVVQLVTKSTDYAKLKLSGNSEDFQGYIALNGQLQLDGFSSKNSSVTSQTKSILAKAALEKADLNAAAKLVSY